MYHKEYRISEAKIYASYIFLNTVQLQYYGTGTYNNHRMLQHIYLALSSLKLEFKINGKLVSLRPDDLFKCFTPDDVIWRFILSTLFYNTLHIELQETLRVDGFIFPNKSTLTTIFPKILRCILSELKLRSLLNLSLI